MPFAATQMDLEMIRLSKVSQTEKDKYRMISLMCTHTHTHTHTHVWNLQDDTNEPSSETDADSQT